MSCQLDFLPDLPPTLPTFGVRLTPRNYQVQNHDKSFELWDSGIRGTLTRAGCATGKTLMYCMMADTWLRRTQNHRAMVVSYERDLVWQFAQEIEDILGIKPGIEMGTDRLDPSKMPPIVIVSRQSLLVADPPTKDQADGLAQFGIHGLGSIPGRKAKSILRALELKNATPEEAVAEIARLNSEPEAGPDGRWSRLFKFDPTYHWLIGFDEAHKYAMHLASVGPLIEWFDHNPESRRCGLTGTPKRSDGVSIGDKLFPGIAIDYPLIVAVADGWCVPYRQKYLRAENVDFAKLERLGRMKDFSPEDMEAKIGEEVQLAKLIEGVLERVDNRQTLIFSPTVKVAKQVAAYINARSRVACPCGKTAWYPNILIGDGEVMCECGHTVLPEYIDRRNAARELDGESPYVERRATYAGHQNVDFQFLSVCGLCREAYNDPNVSCVAVFRPVSKEASSLAEQMKARAARPLRGTIRSDMTRDQRLAAIGASEKPYALIIDLVGCTGLADCASTLQIYAEGLSDEIYQRAQAIFEEKGLDGTADPQEAVEQAKQEEAETRDRIKHEREAAALAARQARERMAAAHAQVEYSEQERGVHSQGMQFDRSGDPNEVTEKQLRYIAFLGMNIFDTVLTKKQGGRIIRQLQQGTPLEEVARTNRISEGNWESVGPTDKQMYHIRGLPNADWIKTKADASLVIDAHKSPAHFFSEMHDAIHKCESAESLTQLARTINRVSKTVRLDQATYAQLIEAGRQRRSQLTPTEF